MDPVFVALSEGATVVTANNRLARSIKLAYNREQPRSCGAWRTPEVLPWRAWMGDLRSRSLDNAGTAGSLNLLSDPQSRTLWRHVVEAADTGLLPGTTSSVADLVGRAWRLSQHWRLTPEQIMAAAESDDSRVFGSLAAAYRQRCNEQNWADTEMLVPSLGKDLGSGRLPPPGPVHLVGFDAWTPLQRELLRVMECSGWTLIEHVAPQPSESVVRQVACRNEVHELELAARWARHIMEVDGSARVGIVVPDLAANGARTRRVILDVFAPDWRLSPPAELPVNFSYGEPLARVGLVHIALIALRALAGQLDYRDAGQLLRSPYVKGGGVEAAARAHLDLWLRERIGTSVSVAGIAARATDRAPLLAECLQALTAVGARMPHGQSAAAWARTFSEVLQAMGWPGERPLASAEYQTVMAWREQLEELCRCDRIAGLIGLERALVLIGSLARDQMFQPAGHPDAIQVLGTLEALGQRFDALWICGLTAEAWPPAARPDSLVPLALQRALRMPDSSPSLTRERAERILHWLEAGATDVVFSYAEYSGDEPLSPSPLIAHLPACPIADLRVWDASDRRTVMAAARASEVLMADPPPPVESPRQFRGGAALLERQARCPARAFLQFRLGARELRSPPVGIDARLRGALTHDVLHDFFAQITDHASLLRLSKDEQAVLLDSIIQRQLERNLPTKDAVMRRIAQHEHIRLRRLIEEFLRLERLRAEFTVLSTECDLVPLVTVPVVASLGITLRPDRVDRLPDDGRLIIDYKTGQSLPAPSELWGWRPRSPQLPLYATLTDAQGIAFVQLAASGVRYLAVAQESAQVAGCLTPAQLTQGVVASWPELRAQWGAALQRLAGEFLEGDFRVDRRHRREAEGQWTLATRVHELPDDDEEGEQ